MLDNTILIDDKGHDTRMFVLRWVRDKSKSFGKFAIYDIVLLTEKGLNVSVTVTRAKYYKDDSLN